MKFKLLRVVPGFVLGLSALALASPALAQDSYCARPSGLQGAYDDGYRTYGYGTDQYARPYQDNRGYAQYAYPQQPYSHYGDSQSDFGYQQYGYQQYGYQHPYGSDYGNGYRGYERGYREDHIRTTFNPFPLPHFEKRIVRHYHPY